MQQKRATSAEEYKRLWRRYMMGLELVPPLKPLPTSNPQPKSKAKAKA